MIHYCINLKFATLFFIAIWFLAVFSLHFLKPDFTPYNHTCSEYANGDFGFIMVIAFFAMAIANILLAFCSIQKSDIFIGILFAIIAVGYIGLGTFIADITISDTPETTAGKIHLFFGFIAMLTINITTFVLASKIKSDVALWIFAISCIISFIIFIVSMNIKSPVFFGIAQRIYLSIATIWFFYITIKMDIFITLVKAAKV